MAGREVETMARTAYAGPKASELRSQDLTDDEIARLGAAIYARIKQRLEPEAGRFVAIAIENGDYRVADTSFEADEALRQTHPNAVFYYARIGFSHSAQYVTPGPYVVNGKP